MIEHSQVETMAFAHETPWHGIGTRVTADLSYDEMAKAAGLDWTVSLRPLFYKDANGKKGQHRMKNRLVLARDSDDAPLSVAGSRYVPVQNLDALRFFDRFVRAGSATMETAGSLRGGKLVWALAKLNSNFKLPGGDTVDGYLFLGSPHEVGKSLLAFTTAIRTVCANTVRLAMSGEKKFEARFQHVREFDPEEASELLTDARERMAKFADEATTLASLKLSKEDALKVLFSVYQPGADRAQVKKMLKDDKLWNPTVRVVWECYLTAPGAQEGTGWGLLNGATYRMNHRAGSNVDNRLSSAWVGPEARRTDVLMRQLADMAA